MTERARMVVLIFLLALTARVAYLEEAKETFLFNYPTVDSGTYEFYAAQTAQGELTTEDASQFSRIPFYRLFLAYLYKFGGRNLYFARFIQGVLGSLVCVFLFFLGNGVFGRRTGILSGIIASLYWPFIAFTEKFLPVNLAIFFGVLAVLALYKFMDRKRIIWLAASGVFFACASLSRANMALFGPAIAALFFFYYLKKDGIKKAFLCGVIFSLAFLAVLAPTIIKDYAGRKEVMPIQKNYAVGLYFGADLDRVNIKPGYTWRKLMREVLSKKLVHIKERNFYFLNKTKDFFLLNPGRYFYNLVEKKYVLWNYYEFSPRENINYFRSQSRFLSLPLFNFGAISALSIFGMLFAWRTRREKALPLYAFVFTYYASIILFMPLSRYRLPIVPFLIIFAAYSGSRLFEMVYQKEWRKFSFCMLFFIPLLLLTNTNVLLSYLGNFSRPHYYKGLVHSYIGEPDNALKELDVAFKKHPRDADIYLAVGDVYLKDFNNLDRAEFFYKRALDIEPAFPEVLEKLGIVYAKKGDIKTAKSIFQKILSDFPSENATTHINLGNCYGMEGDSESAEKEYKRALFLEPENLQGLYRLALLYEETDNPEAASIRARYNELIEALQDETALQ